MPKRTDIEKILLIGSGPIMIGQACEFDYSGTQALKALKEEGYQVVLLNSNPATIMTDPQLSDRVYVEPMTLDFLKRIIEVEKPDALLPTMGGQTALNLTMQLHETGYLEECGVEILGARPDVIRKAEDRDEFKKTMESIGVLSARSHVVHSREDAKKVLSELGLPLVLRPSFTLGGEGGGIVQTEQEFFERVERAIFLSPTNEVLVEESLLGWKEFELEVVRDKKDNVVIVCSIENFDPMGVHTGDSITVAPAQTLTDREYQELRDQAIRIIRAIGVETGGSNIQFSVHPQTGRIIVIEMNPRVSRSSALASKATGFPIARVAAKLAVGYTLDELTNDITKTTPCSFEPSIDYVVTKIPRFDFEKFRPTQPLLGTQMKSVGETMALGRTFEESFSKALAGLEVTPSWLSPMKTDFEKEGLDVLRRPHPKRIWAIADAIRAGMSIAEISELTGIDPWFLDRMNRVLRVEKEIKEEWPLTRERLREVKALGWSDRAIATVVQRSEEEVRQVRESKEVFSSFQAVDTCAAEFEAQTPYLYSTYFGTDESQISDRQKIMIIGGGPNRIGQGIEFDYCCVHAALALRDLGFESVMVNSNPETVSTDFDISDKLYFEPVTAEHVLEIHRKEKISGVMVQFGGQTPLQIAHRLQENGLSIRGTLPSSIDLAEDREKFSSLVKDLEPLGLRQPEATIARTAQEAFNRADELGYPLLIRPSYVLGGRGMKIVLNRAMLEEWIDQAISVSPEHPILIDRFLSRAVEVDVDAISDGQECFIAGVMEHIEEAGIHSGDSACTLPPVTLSVTVLERIRTYTRELAKRLQVVGLMNIQYAIQGNEIYLLEVNPRASRTVPFVSKAVHRPVVRYAVEVMMGKKCREIGVDQDLDLEMDTFNVKMPVFPFHKFPDVDVLLGPEMKSTGEVMGRSRKFAGAYAKALLAAGVQVPKSGTAFLSIRNEDKAEILPLAKSLSDLGFSLVATDSTSEFLRGHHLDVSRVNKVFQGSPHCVESIESGQYALVINTTSNEKAIRDSFSIRRAALERRVPYCTVMSAARMMVEAIREVQRGGLEVLPL